MVSETNGAEPMVAENTWPHAVLSVLPAVFSQTVTASGEAPFDGTAPPGGISLIAWTNPVADVGYACSYTCTSVTSTGVEKLSLSQFAEVL